MALEVALAEVRAGHVRVVVVVLQGFALFDVNVRVRVLGLGQLVRYGGVSVVLVACDHPALARVDADDLLVLEGKEVPGELLEDMRKHEHGYTTRSYTTT